jgi:hypothetical protein
MRADAYTTNTTPSSLQTSHVQEDLIPQEYRSYFHRLVEGNENGNTAFAMFMRVRIVTEICEKLGIPCRTGVDINRQFPVGDRRVSVADIIRALGHRQPNTFKNYRGWVNLARACLSNLESMDLDDPSVKRFLSRARELLRTPLGNAVVLEPARYGKISDFNILVKSLAVRYNLGGTNGDDGESS